MSPAQLEERLRGTLERAMIFYQIDGAMPQVANMIVAVWITVSTR